MTYDLQNHTHTQRCLGGCVLARRLRSPRRTTPGLHAGRVPPVSSRNPMLSPAYRAMFGQAETSTKVASQA